MALNVLFTVENFHLRKRKPGAAPVAAFFLKQPSLTTSKSTSDVSYHPADTPLPSCITESKVIRVRSCSMAKTYFSKTEKITPINYWDPCQLQKDRKDLESSREEHESAAR